MFLNKNHNYNVQKNTSGRFKNAFPKIMSVIAALILWIYVVDTQTTIEEKVISRVPVILENFDNSGNIDIVSGKEHTIEVTVSGTKNALAEVSQKDIFVSADMNGIDTSGTYKLDLNISVPNGITVINKSASEVSVTVDKTTTKNAMIDVELHYDILNDSIYEIGEYILSQSSVQVTGPQNIVDSVEKVKVVIKQNEIKNSFKAQASLTPVDANGNVVSSPYIKLSQTTVSVRVPVYKTATVSIVPKFDNSSKYNYSYKVIPDNIVIKGDPADIDGIENVKTVLISAKEPTRVIKQLDLPDDITAYTTSGELITSVEINIIDVKEIKPLLDEGSEF